MTERDIKIRIWYHVFVLHGGSIGFAWYVFHQDILMCVALLVCAVTLVHHINADAKLLRYLKETQ